MKRGDIILIGTLLTLGVISWYAYAKSVTTKSEQMQQFKESAALHQGYWTGVRAALDNVKLINKNTNCICTFFIEMETLINIDNQISITNENAPYRPTSITRSTNIQ